MTGPASNVHAQRQAQLAAALAAAGLRGAVVFSRGGSTLDRYGDVLYLTGFYQSYSYLPDMAGLFSGRAHAALVISADGASVLCVAVKEFEPGTVTAGGIRCSEVFTGTVAAAMTELGLGSGMVGLIGADVLPYSQNRLLGNKLTGLVWQECDEILQAIRRIKSPTEQDAIRRAAAVHVAALSALHDAIAPGVTEADLVATFSEVAVRGGAGVYFTALSSGPNIAHWCGRPSPGFSTRRLVSGDMVRFDMGIVLDGYLSDFGRTAVVGPPRADQQRLIDTLHSGIDAMIGAVAAGRTVRDAVAMGDAALKDLSVAARPAGVGIIHSSFPAHWGHGLGMGWERPILCDTEDMTLAAGMYLAIERTLTLPGTGTAAAEQTLLVTETGIEILSGKPGGKWA